MLIAICYNWTLWHTVHLVALWRQMAMFFHTWSEGVGHLNCLDVTSGTAISPPLWREALGILQDVEETKLQVPSAKRFKQLEMELK